MTAIPPYSIDIFGPGERKLLVVEVHGGLEPRLLRPMVSLWKQRCAVLGRPASLLIEPFATYFWSGKEVVAWFDKEPAITLSFGDAWDPQEPLSDITLGGTHYLWGLAGLPPVDRDNLTSQAVVWLRTIAGSGSAYLPPCPGSAGLARLWLASILKSKEMGYEVLQGVGQEEMPGLAAPGSPGQVGPVVEHGADSRQSQGCRPDLHAHLLW